MAITQVNIQIFKKNYQFTQSLIYKGGAGYVLSKEAFGRLGRQLEKNQSYCQITGTEDVDVARCLRRLGVYPNKSIDEQGRERFHPLDLGYHYLGGFPGTSCPHSHRHRLLYFTLFFRVAYKIRGESGSKSKLFVAYFIEVIYILYFTRA